MNITLFKQVLKAYLNANVPIHVWGDGGIGKSQVVESVVENDLDWHLVDLRLATQEVGDLIGLPFIEKRMVEVEVGKNPDGSRNVEKVEKTIQSWSIPEWVMGVFEASAKGIPSAIFMDEMDRAPKEVIQAVYQLCTKKQLHHHKLPVETRIIAAGNPPTEEYMVDAFDKAMDSRWGHVLVDADADTWIAQFGSKCDPDISGFIATSKNHLMRKAQPWDVDSICKPTPRCWEMVNKLYVSNIQDKMVLRVAIAAIVGAATATEFMNSLDKDWIRIEDIMSGKKTIAHLKDSDDANIKTIRLAHELSHYLTNDILTTSSSGGKYKEKELKLRRANLADLMEHLISTRKELMIAAMKYMLTRDSILFRTLLTDSKKVAQVVGEAASLSTLLGTR